MNDTNINASIRRQGEGLQVWCRVLRQRVSSVMRTVVVISPQFVVRSQLPRPLILHLTTPATRRTHQVDAGWGCRIAVGMA